MNNQTTNIGLRMVSKQQGIEKENEGEVEDIIKRSVNDAHVRLFKNWIATKVDTILLICTIMVGPAATIDYALNNSQLANALSSSPMSPLELKKAVAEHPYWKNIIGNSSLVADEKIRLCGEQADLLKLDYGSQTFSRKTGEFLARICDHNVLYWKGMCMTYFNIFSYCGPSGNLQAYLEVRNLTNNLPEKQFLNFGDGSIDENSTNIYLAVKGSTNATVTR